MNNLLAIHFPPIQDVPKIGDMIYVPSIKADISSSCAWTQMKKEGGYAKINNIQVATDNKHLIFITEYGGFGMWWEEYLQPLQEELSKKYGILIRAHITA